MSAFANVNAALDARLNELPGLPPTAWENVQFEPVNGTLYLRPTFLPGFSEPKTTGPTNFDLNVGIYQVDVFATAGAGKFDAVEMADNIADFFKHGTVMNYNGAIVTIKTVSRKSANTTADGWYQIPVDIEYYAFTEWR